MSGYDPQSVIFALMIGIHHITAFLWQIFRTVYICMDKAVALHDRNCLLRHLIAVLLCKTVSVTFYVAGLAQIEQDEWK